jgi:maltose/moltooligosaccharide transporter
MEPYRAYVSDRLNRDQHSLGFLTQSAFTGLAQTLAYLTPSHPRPAGHEQGRGGRRPSRITARRLPHGRAAVDHHRVVERPQGARAAADRRRSAEAREAHARLRRRTCPRSARPSSDMPPTDAPLAVDEAVPVVRDDVLLDLHRAGAGGDDVRHQSDHTGFREASLLNGQIGGFYNFVAFVAAFAMVPVTRRFGPKVVHAMCLTLAAAAWPCGPSPRSRDAGWLFMPMVGVGLAWASIMGNPYVMLAGSIPPERAGVYMGIFNMFIVIPMLIQMLTLPLYYDSPAGRPARRT